MAARTLRRRISPRSTSGHPALAAGVVSVLALPVAVLAIVLSGAFDLPAAGVAVPIALVFGAWAAAARQGGVASRLLGKLGLCLGGAGATAFATLLMLRLLEA